MVRRATIPLTLALALLLSCSRLAVGLSVREPFSAHMKRAELIFIGTVTKKEYVRITETGRVETDLTFDVKQLIMGTPNIDKDTVKFSAPGGLNHWSSMGQGLRRLEVGDTVMMLLMYNWHIAQWMRRYEGLYVVSGGHGCWFVKSKKVDNKTEYTVYIWVNTKDILERYPYVGFPLPLCVNVIKAARKYPQRIDPLMEIMSAEFMEAISDGVKPDTPEAHSIHEPIIANFEQLIDELEAINDDGGKDD